METGVTCDLRHPGQREYFKIVEEFSEYCQIHTLHQSKQIGWWLNIYIRVKCGILRLIRDINGALCQCFVSVLPQTIKNVSFDLQFGPRRKRTFYPPLFKRYRYGGYFKVT